MAEHSVAITRVSHADESAEVVYGLQLRGVRAVVRSAGTPGPDPYEVLVRPSDEPVARAVLPRIWDAILGTTRAMTPNGNCPFCGYDQRGVPTDRPCPECGVPLGSVEARRAYRDRRRPDPRLLGP